MNYSYNSDTDKCANGCQSPMDEFCEFNPDCSFHSHKPKCCCECKQTRCCECKPDCCCECKPDCCCECKPNCCCECKVNCCCECKPNYSFDDYYEEEYCKRPKPRPVPIKGRIDVTSKLGCVEGEPLSGVAVELYRVDCTSGFELVSCQYTDSCGCVSFICLEDGLYAIKQPLDPCYFEQPEYYPCYEVCITPCCKRRGVIIINNLKPRDMCNRPPILPKCGLF